MAKNKKGKPHRSGGARQRRDPDRVPRRNRLSVMLGAMVVACSIASAFAIHRALPAMAAREAQRAVEAYEAGRNNDLQRFQDSADRTGHEILGWETQVFPRLTLVTFVYRKTGSPERKAFWWAYDPARPADQRVHRVTSVQEFVDSYLLPTVDQLQADVTGIPGPLARVRHQNET